jgi:hypothetical protein
MFLRGLMTIRFPRVLFSSFAHCCGVESVAVVTKCGKETSMLTSSTKPSIGADTSPTDGVTAATVITLAL